MAVISRAFEVRDSDLLSASLRRDEYHKDTETEFFRAFGSVCNVYEDELGPVLFCRGTKALRIDIQFVDNRNAERNRRVMLEGFPDLVAKAKAAGFTELIFNTSNPLLRRFCQRRLGFKDSQGELRRFL